ncbi:MAG: hypothetical protein ACE5DL_02450 [Nitrosopumilaceae archaeon]
MKQKFSIKKIAPTIMKTIFKRETKFSAKCSICGLEFTNPGRTQRHMVKAHSKPKKEKQI